MVVAVPILVTSLLFARRGSRAAQAVWLGALAYSLYNYAYYVFGAGVQRHLRSAHRAVRAVDHHARACSGERRRRRDRSSVPGSQGDQMDGGFLAVVGAVLGGLWVFLAIRFAITGELMADIPADGLHLVFAIRHVVVGPGARDRRGPALAAHPPGLRVRDGDGCHGRHVSGEPLDGGFVPSERERARRQGIPDGGHRPRDWFRAGYAVAPASSRAEMTALRDHARTGSRRPRSKREEGE